MIPASRLSNNPGFALGKTGVVQQSAAGPCMGLPVVSSFSVLIHFPRVFYLLLLFCGNPVLHLYLPRTLSHISKYKSIFYWRFVLTVIGLLRPTNGRSYITFCLIHITRFRFKLEHISNLPVVFDWVKRNQAAIRIKC